MAILSDVVHQLHVSHVDFFAHSTGVFAPVMMPSQLQVLVKLAALKELHAALAAFDIHRWFTPATEWILHFWLPVHLFLPSECVGTADEALPLFNILCGYS